MCVCTLLCTWKMKWMHNAKQNKMKTKREWKKDREQKYRTSNSNDMRIESYGPRVFYWNAMAFHLKRESGTVVYHFKWWKKWNKKIQSGKIPSMGVAYTKSM